MTTFTSLRANAGFALAQNISGGGVVAARGHYTLTTAPIAGDIYQLCKVPAGANILGGWLMAADIDTGTGVLDMDWGWAANGVEVADPDGFGNLGAWTGDAITGFKPTVGVFYPMQGVFLTGAFITFSATTMIEVVCITPPNAGGTGVLKCVVLYSQSGDRP